MANSLLLETSPGPKATEETRASSTTLAWPAPPPGFCYRLPQPGAHVWAFPLDLQADRIQTLKSILDPSELARADRYRFRRDRDRFIAGRAQLRILLARYLQTEPAALDFVYGPHGKPALSPRWAAAGLRFNLAHSEDLAIAVVASDECGIDVERIRSLDDMDDLVARFFAPRENLAFQNLAPHEKAPAFFNLWTRKEAWLKAIGEGIGYALDQVEVSFLAGAPARLLALPKTAGPVAQWRLETLAPAAGFIAALAQPRAPGPISRFQLSN